MAVPWRKLGPSVLALALGVLWVWPREAPGPAPTHGTGAPAPPTSVPRKETVSPQPASGTVPGESPGARPTPSSVAPAGGAPAVPPPAPSPGPTVAGGAKVRGLVQADGPLEDVLIEAMALDPGAAEDAPRERLAARSDARGCFQLEGLRPGRWRLEALRERPKGVAWAEVVIDEGGALVQGVALHLESPGRLSGRLLQSGQPLPGRTVSLGTAGPAHETGTAADGSFAFAGLIPGTHELSYLDRESAQPLMVVRKVEVRSGEEVIADLVLPAGAGWRGRLLAADGTPLAGATLRVERLTGEVLVGALARPGLDGGFAWPLLEAGEYRVRVSAGTKREWTLRVYLPPDGQADIRMPD